MTKKITIVKASKDDSELIESLAKEIWTQHYTPIIGKDNVEYMLGQFQTCTAIKADIDQGFEYYIAFLDGIPCGYTSVTLRDGVFLSKLYMKKEHRGKGLGKTLFNKTLDFAKKHNQERIWLKCYKHNPTLSVYYKLGFEVVENVISDFGNGCLMDDYVLEKKLL